MSVEPVITDGSEDGSELVEVRDARVAPMRRPTPHGDKLRELLNNSKLPAPDLPRVRDAIGRYEEWIASVAALTIPKRTIASGLLIPPSTTALAAAPWSHSRIWPALLPWQEARLSQSRGTSSATLSQSRHTHQASWRSNHSHIPPPLKHLHRLLPKQTIMLQPQNHRHEKPPIPWTSISMSKKREAVHSSPVFSRGFATIFGCRLPPPHHSPAQDRGWGRGGGATGFVSAVT